MQLKRIGSILALTSLMALPQQSEAAPRPLQDDIQVRQLLKVPERTMRIAKDPRNNALYLQRLPAISRKSKFANLAKSYPLLSRAACATPTRVNSPGPILIQREKRPQECPSMPSAKPLPTAHALIETQWTIHYTYSILMTIRSLCCRAPS